MMGVDASLKLPNDYYKITPQQKLKITKTTDQLFLSITIYKILLIPFSKALNQMWNVRFSNRAESSFIVFG